MNTETQNVAKLEGTCPACFRTMAINADGTVARHGWQEQGGRQVGQYNQAWHVGACYGVGRRPFEVSPEGTIGFIADVIFPMALRAQAYRDHLITSPAIVLEFSTRVRVGRNFERVDCPWSVRLQPGDAESVIGEYPNQTRIPSYETAWTRKLEEATRNLGALNGEGVVLSRRVETWKPERLQLRDTAPTVHFHAPGARRHLCAGLRSTPRGIATTADRAAVTCSRCLKSLEAGDAYTAKVEAEKADAAALVAFIRSFQAGRPEGATIAQIKAGLGWDTKRVNRAIDRDDRRTISRSWDAGPTRYTANA